MIMKKIFAGLLCTAMLFGAGGQCGINRAYAMTKVADAETAVEKSLEAFKEALGKAEITNDFTRDDLTDMLYGACDYTVDGYVGCGFSVEKFKLIKATDSEAGYLKATVIIDLNSDVGGYEFEIPIPALGGVDAADSTDTGASTSDTEESTADISETEAKKELEAAKRAIHDAMYYDFEVSNDTTVEEIIAMAKNAIPSGSHVTVIERECSVDIIKASTTVNGTLRGDVWLKCGSFEDGITVAKTIEPIVTSTSKLIAEDKSAVSKAIAEAVYDNSSTGDTILAIAKKAIKNGSTVAWKNNTFIKEASTATEEGRLFGDLIMTLGDESREIGVDEAIPKVISKMPTDKVSVNSAEWEILRRTNIERAKVGDNLLGMTAQLQKACNTRETDLNSLYSHTRPDGTTCYTAIKGSDEMFSIVGENISSCTPGHNDAEHSMTLWMNSPVHKENILRSSFDVIGVGNDSTYAVQMFAGLNEPFAAVTTSAGTMTFKNEDAMQKAYLICTMSDGTEAYVPISVEALTKVSGGYQMKLNCNEPVIFKITDSIEESAAKANADTSKDTDTKKADSTAKIAFTDVKAGDYFETPVKWAVEKNITTGTSATTFSPNDTCTKAQILTFLWRAVGSPKTGAENPFTDVSASDYYYNAAVWASEKGMVSGNVFAADTPCTRESTVTYIWKNAGAVRTAVSDKFTDVSSSADYAEAVAWAVENGVTSGTSETTFSPDDTCTRGQIVTFLSRALSD